MHLSALCVHSHFSLGKHDVFTQWATGAFDSLSWVKLRTVCTSSLLSLAFDSLLYLRGIPSDAIGPHTWRADMPWITDIPSHGAQEASQIERACTRAEQPILLGLDAPVACALSWL